MNGIDKFFSGMRSSSSGLMAERVRIDVIAENIANAKTTRTPEGGPYRRKVVMFEPLVESALHAPHLVQAVGINRDPRGLAHQLQPPVPHLARGEREQHQ